VKTDFIKNHMSKLLSHTLKAGNGGALPDPKSDMALAAAAAENAAVEGWQGPKRRENLDSAGKRRASESPVPPKVDLLGEISDAYPDVIDNNIEAERKV
jgi:hypothetical protein